MVGISCVYDAMVFRTVEGQLVSSEEQVDLLNLEALSFDKIVINTDVDLGNCKVNYFSKFF